VRTAGRDPFAPGGAHSSFPNSWLDPALGAIAVFDGRPTEFYPTPQHLGPVHMAAVTGTPVTVLPDNAPPTPVVFVFVFDLGTRQWVGP